MGEVNQEKHQKSEAAGDVRDQFDEEKNFQDPVPQKLPMKLLEI